MFRDYWINLDKKRIKTGKMWRLMKKLNNRFLLLIVMIMVLYGCKQGQKAEQLKGNEEEIEGEVVNIKYVNFSG